MTCGESTAVPGPPLPQGRGSRRCHRLHTAPGLSERQGSPISCGEAPGGVASQEERLAKYWECPANRY